MAKTTRSKKSTGRHSRHGRRRSASSSPSPPHASTPSPLPTEPSASQRRQSSQDRQVVVPQASVSTVEQPSPAESESASVASSESQVVQTGVEPQLLPSAQSSHGNEPPASNEPPVAQTGPAPVVLELQVAAPGADETPDRSISACVPAQPASRPSSPVPSLGSVMPQESPSFKNPAPSAASGEESQAEPEEESRSKSEEDSRAERDGEPAPLKRRVVEAQAPSKRRRGEAPVISYSPDASDAGDDEEEDEVTLIRDRRGEGESYESLIKWQGDGALVWKPLSELKSCAILVALFDRYIQKWSTAVSRTQSSLRETCHRSG